MLKKGKKSILILTKDLRIKYEMKEEEFRARVAELAEIEDIKVPEVSYRSKKEEDELGDLFPPGENPTLGFELKKLKPNAKLCELGCGEIVDNQIIQHKMYTFPVTHWRTKCMTCNCTLSPDKKGFLEDTKTSVQNAFVQYFKTNSKD